MKDNYNKIFGETEKVMFIFAHPDDAEVYAGGTIARLLEEGKKVNLCIVTNGGKGMRESREYTEETLAKQRLKEMIVGASKLGLTQESVINLNLPDGEVNNSFENIGLIVRQIRNFKPDLIITHNPIDKIIEFDPDTHWVNHRDHRNTGELVMDAIYPYSRDNGFYTDHFDEGLESHSVYKLMYVDAYMYDDKVCIEITNQNTKKVEALKSHISQLDEKSAIGYADECKVGEKYFETFRYLEVY